MNKDICRQLRICQEFQRLTVPIGLEEFQRMEEEILSGGEPPRIVVWDDVILDGYTQYELCQKHGLPVCLEEKSFSCQEAAITWICANQLKQESLTEEMRRFLIGTRYLVENRLNKDRREADARADAEPVGRKLSERLGREYGISLGSVERYTRYTRALGRMRSHVPALVAGILTGQIKISQEEVTALSRLERGTLQRAASQKARLQRVNIFCQTSQKGREKPPLSIKDMPSFDPDAEITSLTLTIPSWNGSIDRMRTHVSLNNASRKAKTNLKQALERLQKNISDVLSEMGEV